MEKIWIEKAWDGFEQLSQERKTQKRVFSLVKDIERNGYNGIGKPEPLKWDMAGYWSRRIDEENRLVYRIEGNTVRIVQCGTHYGDK